MLGTGFIPVPRSITLDCCRSTLHLPHPSLTAYSFSTGYSPWFLGTMVHIERFILSYPNLISVEGLGTLPEHCLRSLGKLLGQLPIFRRDCSSLPGNWNVPRRGMPSHSVFDGSLFIAVPCLPHVRLGLMMLVTLTHHSFITVISL